MGVRANSLRDMMISGIGWSAVAQAGNLSLRFAISVVLARLLVPRDFGLVGMIAVFTGFTLLFSGFVFGHALIQKGDIGERHYISVFWVNLCIALILTALVMVCAPLIATFFGEPILVPLTRIMAFNLIALSLGSVQSAILRRKMEFRSLAAADITALVAGGLVGVILALLGYGVWSLVWQLLANSTVRSVLLWRNSGWRPGLSFDRSAIADVWKFSTNLMGFNVLNYWVRNGDDMLIGRYLGGASLGIYARAYSLMMLPLDHVYGVLTTVMFPALSRVQGDTKRVKRIYLQSLAMIALVTFPMMIGLLVVAESFVLAIYGPKWHGMIPILRIFSVVGMLQSIGTTVGWIYQSQGRTDWMFRWGLASGPLVIGSIVIGILIGTVEAVAMSYAIAGIILLYPLFAIPGKLIDMTVGNVVGAIAATLGSAAAMGFLIWIVGELLPKEWPHWANLAVQVPIGMGVYGALVHFLRLPAYQEARDIIREKLQSRLRPAEYVVRP